MAAQTISLRFSNDISNALNEKTTFFYKPFVVKRVFTIFI